MVARYGSCDGQKPAQPVKKPPQEALEDAQQRDHPLHHQFDQVSEEPVRSSSSWWSRLVFGDTSYLFEIVKERPLVLQDLQQLDDNSTSAGALSKQELLCHLYYDVTNRSLVMTIWRMEWKRLVLSGLLLLLSVPCALGPIVLLYVILMSFAWQSNEHDHSATSVFACMGAFFLCSELTNLARAHATLAVMRIGYGISTACKSLIFQSTLADTRVNGNGIAEMTSLNSRVEGVVYLIIELHDGWVSLLELGGEIYILHRMIKAQLWVVVSSLVALFALVMLATSVESRYKQYSSKSMAARWQVINECIRGVQSMKLNAWEEKFEKKINGAREIEVQSMFRMLCVQGVRMVLSWCQEELSVAASFIVFAVEGLSLDPAFAFSIILLAQQMKGTLQCLIQFSNTLRNGLSAVKSTEEHLNRIVKLEEHGHAVVHTNVGQYSSTTVVATRAACLAYATNPTEYVLMNVSIRVNKGELVVVHGKAGEGKTTLLTALLGEVMCMNGEVFVSGECRVAYCSQEPWMQSITIRENILFGSPYDEKKYCAVLDACCLIEDLSVLPNGDRTVIGPRGINLSGGQKARIALARACYADADLYVLDCPLASVDAVVQMDVFRKCIVELLRYKTVLLATHNAEFIHSGLVDRLLEVSDNSVREQGLRQVTKKENIVSLRVKALEASFWGARRCSNAMKSNRKNEAQTPTSQGIVQGVISSQTKARLETIQRRASPLRSASSLAEQSFDSNDVMKDLWQFFNKTPKSRILLVVGCLSIMACEICLVSKNLWLASWTSGEPVSYLRGAFVYGALVVGASGALWTGWFIMSVSTSTAADSLFRKMLHAILHAPFSFFYSIPTGAVLNRFFMDMLLLDRAMVHQLMLFLAASSAIVGTFLVLSVQLGWTVVVLVWVMWRILFRNKVVDLVVSVTLLQEKNDSTDLSFVSEALEGISVIRAFGESTIDQFVSNHRRCVEDSNRLEIANVAMSNNQVLYLSLLQGLINLDLAMLLAINSPGTFTGAASLGLTLMYSLNFPAHVLRFLNGWYSVIFRMISAKRLFELCSIQPEEGSAQVEMVNNVCKDSDGGGWLLRGELVFDRVWFRYSEDAADSCYALKDVSFSITAGSKIGVVGRTGSGKSSIAMALLRVHELVRGHIVVDGTDIRCLRLHALRRELCIIPQSPMIYRSTVREYLDPFDEFSDHDLWEVIRKTALASFVQSLQTALDENGENWSLGQRQLLCLARAMLRPSKIVILDEPFSSIDGENDKQLLSVLSSELRESTVLFVTHRLDQVMEFCDKILVMKDGEVEDFGTVEELVGRSDGVFFELLENTLLTS